MGYIWIWGKYKVLVLLADDHALVREGLKHALVDLDSDLEFIEAATAAEVVDRLSSHPTIKLALLDLVMPGSTGFGLLAHVCNTYPNLPVTILSGSTDPAQMRKALDVGASGFITKSASAEVMLSALRLIMAGGIYVPPEMVRPNSATAETINDPDRRPPLGTDKDARSDALTTRQHEVLERLEEGKSNKQIARELELSEHTVKIHVTRILRALGVSNRTQAAVMARAQGKKGASSG
jgi:DNA-binding NarL/FixJ family response regulator